jgi:hypothetical protein
VGTMTASRVAVMISGHYPAFRQRSHHAADHFRVILVANLRVAEHVRQMDDLRIRNYVVRVEGVSEVKTGRKLRGPYR